MKKVSAILLFILSSLFFIQQNCKAQYNVLVNFNATNGAFPNGSLTLNGKVLYWMTLDGGVGAGKVIVQK